MTAKPITAGRDAAVPKIMDADEIRQVVEYFASAAERCMKAGFDFVEIHAGHGYLISSFLTPHFNRRTDQYGGSFENRIRFLIEILRAIKARVGHKIAVGVKINGDDFIGKEGWQLEDCCRTAPILEAEGADYITVTASVMGAARLTIPPLYEKQGCFADMGAAVKKTVSIPVGVVGRIKNPQMGEDLLRQGKADIICMGRAMIADPEIVEKARFGRLADIRPCLAECRGCIEEEMRAQARGQAASGCIVNPRVLREAECIDIEGNKKGNPKTIIVAGAGISGLEAARRAAFSGHKVMLCDSRSWLGGQVRFAAMMPGRHEIGDILPWYERQLNRHGVDIRLNTTLDAAFLDALKPDIVVVATGSLPRVPQYLTGILDRLGDVAVVTVDDLLEERVPAGENILVLGGDQIGMQIADYLSENGSRVTVAEAHGHFAQKLAANDRWYLVGRTVAKGVKRIKHVGSLDVNLDGEICIMTGQDSINLPGIDMIVLASERQSQRSLAEIATAQGYAAHIVGDAFDVVSEDAGTYFANIAQAYDLARSL